MVLTVEDYLFRPATVFLIGEIGSGKSTVIKLISAYHNAMMPLVNMESPLFTFFEEHIPDEPLWSVYQEVLRTQTPSQAIYEVQTFFMNQKLVYLSEAENRGMTINLIERHPLEDFVVFAGGKKKLFLDGDFAKYVQEYSNVISTLRLPDLVVRLYASPEISIERVKNRKTGETSELGAYQAMAELYSMHIDTWINSSGVPCIPIKTDKLDLRTKQGQFQMISTLFDGLKAQDFWKKQDYSLPLPTHLLDLSTF